MNSWHWKQLVALALFAVLGDPTYLAAIDFAAAKSYPVGTSPGGVAVGDFNGDGKLDIAVANTGSGNVSILLGNGDGTFQPAVNVAVGCNPTAIAVGDFNGDGKLDLAAFQRGLNTGVAGSVSILLGNGDGTFQAPKKLALGQDAVSMLVADFNLDKKSDLAIGTTSHIDIFLGNGDGTFQPAKPTTVPGFFSEPIVAADFNGDSKPDLALTFSVNGGVTIGIQILLGNGDGTFVNGGTLTVAFTNDHDATTDSLVSADFNNDGKVDLLISAKAFPNCIDPIGCPTAPETRISAFLGNGNGSFQAERRVVSGIASGTYRDFTVDRPFVGDFNGDGKVDVIYRRIAVNPPNSQSLQIAFGHGDGTFSTALSDLQNANPFVDSIEEAQDLNADKLTDLVALGSANDIDVLLNTSPTSGADLTIVSAGASPEPAGIGGTVTYTADVRNQGPQNATGVIFTDTLPSNVNFVSATSSQGTCANSNGMVTCTVGALDSPLDFTVKIVVTPSVAGTLTNSMNVTANETDPNTADNTATQTTSVVPVFKLTVNRTGNGAGTVTTPDGGINCGTTCSATYLSGTGLQVNETPDANSLFSGWSGACTGTGACAVTMNGDMTVTANFVLGQKLSVALAGTGSGSVTSKDGGINCANSGGSCSSLYTPGASVLLTATPAAPSVFGEWSGACTGTDPNVCSLTMNSVQSVTATFNPPPPDFTLAPASTSFTVQTGAQVTDALTLAGQNGFTGAVTLTCAVTGPAPMASCAVSPSPVTLGSSSGTSTLTMTAPATLAAAALRLNEGNLNAVYAVVLPFPVLLLGGIGLASGSLKKRRHCLWLMGGSVIVLLGVIAGCGGGGSHPQIPQNYTVTVTATSGSLKHSATVKLTVQ